MGMKRFSAPPALYPSPKACTVVAQPSAERPAPLTDVGLEGGPAVGGHGGGHGDSGTPHQAQHQQQQKHHQQHRHLPHFHQQHQQQNNQHHQHKQQTDWSGKRERNEQTFEWILDRNQHSDVTVVVNDEEGVFHVHRAVLQHKSDIFAQIIAKVLDTSDAPDMIRVTGSVPIVLHVQEDSDCSAVYSRFLYFLYSGAVWLHQDYVLPLYRLAAKYKVASLLTHCQAYILQILAKSCLNSSNGNTNSSSSSNRHHNHNHIINNNNSILSYQHHEHDHSPTAISPNGNTPLPNGDALSPNGNSQAPQLQPYAGSGFPLDVVCDLFEDDRYGEGDIRQTAYKLLCCQFRQLVQRERWLRCRVATVCRLLASDACAVEESLILQAATDYMKRNTLADKRQIQDILALVRYPRLQRRVLYHLHKSGSFHNFPHIQQLMLNAVKFHSFKDLPEAKQDFVGAQFRPRLGLAGSGNTTISTSSDVVVTAVGLDGGGLPEDGDGRGGTLDGGRGGGGSGHREVSPHRPASARLPSAELTGADRVASFECMRSSDRLTSSDHVTAGDDPHGAHHQRHRQQRLSSDMFFEDDENHRHNHHREQQQQHHDHAPKVLTATAMTQTVQSSSAFALASEYPLPVTIIPRQLRHSQV